MRKISLFTVMWVFSLGSPIHAQTLKEAVQQSLALHPEILQNQAETSSAKQGIAEARGAYFPKVDVNSAYGREWTQSPFTQDLAGDNSTTLNRQEFSVALVQNIYSGGALVGEVDRNTFIYRSQAFKTMAVMNDIALDVTRAYLDVLLQEELVHIAKTNLTTHKKLFNLIQERTQAGVSRAAELDQAESRFSFAEANLYSAEGNQREAAVRFRKLVGVWPDKLINPILPPDELIPPTPQKAVEEGFRNHPEIKSAQEDIKEAMAQRKIAKAAFFPKLDAVLSASRNRNLDGVPGANNDNLGMLRVSYNAFKGGSDVGHFRKAAFLVQASLEHRDKSMIDIREKILLDYNSWYASRKRATALRDYVTSMEKTRYAYFEQFKIGQRTFLDLLNSVNEVTRSQNEYLQAKKEEIEAKYRILNGIGRLMPFFFRQSEQRQSSTNLFNLPKTNPKTTVAVNQPSMGALNKQIIQPTGNTTISSITPPTANSLPTPPVDNGATSSASTQVANEYFIELRGFSSKQKTEEMLTNLWKKGYKAQSKVNAIDNSEEIMVGPFNTFKEADNTLHLIQLPLTIKGVVIRELSSQNSQPLK